MDLPGAKNSQLLATVFLVIAFTATFLAGLFGGVGFGTVLIRAILFSLLLGLVGFGAGTILERFVPEAWNSSSDNSSDVNAGEDDSEDEDNAGSAPGGMVDFTVGQEEELPPPPKADLEALPDIEEHVSIPTRSSSSKRGGEVVGNYRFIDDKKFPEDPEDYAKAVRTMMRKDD